LIAPGGKDGHPFPVPLKIYDETLRVLRQAVDRAKLGQADKLAGLARLDDQCRLAEAAARGKPWPASAASMLAAVVAQERRVSPALDGPCVARAGRGHASHACPFRPFSRPN
jgi:uncharacterized protein